MTFTTISDSDLRLKHLDSMVALLNRRLAAARASHNDQLSALLEQEYEQLMVAYESEPVPAAEPASRSAIAAWMQALWNTFADTMPGLYQLQVNETVNDAGNPGWQVYYPKTGQTFWTESEAELRAWMKQTYWKA